VSESWWVLRDDYFMDALRRAHAGEDPDMLYIEYHANSETGTEDE